jgi:hemerythrin-like metal-binding protein
MALMQWDETMSVGVAELDDQHKTLIELINVVYEAIQRHDEPRLGCLVDQMAEYGRVHFATEEQHMRNHGFPDVEAHRFQHAKFNISVADFRKKLYGKTNLSQVFVFLSRWLVAHIMDEDMRYTAFIASREESGPAS